MAQRARAAREADGDVALRDALGTAVTLAQAALVTWGTEHARRHVAAIAELGHRRPDASDKAQQSDREPRFFIDHGVIHDRKTGKHVRSTSKGPGDGEDGIEECCALLNALVDEARDNLDLLARGVEIFGEQYERDRRERASR